MANPSSTNVMKIILRHSLQPNQTRLSFVRSYACSSRATEIDYALSTLIKQSREDSFQDENACARALARCLNLARITCSEESVFPSTTEFSESPVQELLDLDTRAGGKDWDRSVLASDRQHVLNEISKVARNIMLHSSTFINPALLRQYVGMQCLLRKPFHFPEVFDAYAAKPVSTRTGTIDRGQHANPLSAKAAIPFDIAVVALESAIRTKSLSLCLNIISVTVATPAYRRSRFLRRGLLPCCGMALAPGAAYVLGKTFASWQERLDPNTATAMGTIGFLTYFGMTSMLGYITVTTANDQMKRVTWVPGTPLYVRWMREDERYLVDKVAQAWGFQDPLRYGEEDDAQWMDLGKWIRGKGMVLDNVKLLDGME